MQKRDTYQKLEDFLFDESFQKWVKHNEDSTNWREWALGSVERAKLVEEARHWILAMRVDEVIILSQETQRELQKTWERISDSGSSKSIKPLWQSTWFRSAAAIFFIGSIALFLFNKDLRPTSDTIITYQDLVEKNDLGLIEQINNSDKPQLITLSDASSILLQPKSKLSFPKTFKGNERKVFLSGEGFFEISKDPKKPFYVYANETITKVYGTSFRIIAYANQPNVQILVKTGKVKVSSNTKGKRTSFNEVMLQQNQAARFVREGLHFEKIIDVTQDKPLLATTNAIEQLSFEFDDIHVSQIFTTIEKAYLINIDFPKEKLKDCFLTTSLSDEPLPEKLKIICESLGGNTQYEMNGNQITISSNGCN